MQKTTTIHLNQTLFNIEERAFEKLEKYLESIRRHFTKSGDAEEIVSDIEASAAIHFGEKIKGSHKVVTLKDVEDLIKVMGDIKDMAEDEEEEKETVKPGFNPGKKLFRDSDDKVLGGVAAGVASYLGMETSIFRIVLVAVFLLIHGLSGPLVLTYLILWVLLPESKTTADKIMMKGEPINLTAIQNEVSSKAALIKSEGAAKYLRMPREIVSQSVKAGVNVISKIIPFTSFIVGLLIIVGTALGIAGITSVAVNLAINPVVQLPETTYWLILCLIYFIAFAPLIFVLQIGSAFMNRKPSFNIWGNLFMFMAWVFALITLAFSIVRLGPEYRNQIEKYLQGLNVRYYSVTEPVDMSNTSNINVANFDRVEVFGIKELVITQSNQQELVGIGKKEALEKVSFEVEGGTLKIKNVVGAMCVGSCLGTQPVRVEIKVPTLLSLKTTGNLKTEVEMSQRIGMVFESLGNSFIQLKGEVPELKLMSTGNSTITSLEMKSRRVELNALGNSNIKVQASEELEVSATGNSTIEYSGNPKVNEKIMGNTTVTKIE